MSDETSTPKKDTWVNVHDVVQPKNITDHLTAHFAFCHIRPTHSLMLVHHGAVLRLEPGTVSVIIGVENDRYVLATRLGKVIDFSAADAVKDESKFRWTSITPKNFFDGPWQVYYFKPNLLHVF